MSDIQGRLKEEAGKLQKNIDLGKEKIINTKEIASIKRKISDANKHKVNLLITLGQRAYFLYRAGLLNDEEIEELAKGLQETDTGIGYFEKQIKEIVKSASGKACSKCNGSVDATDSFCGNCGASVKEEAEKPMVTCIVCSSEIPNESNFCGYCGSKRGEAF